MVALLEARTAPTATRPARTPPARTRPATRCRPSAGQRRLVVVEGGRSEAAPVPVTLLVAVAAVVLVVGVVGLRLAQGGPTATGWEQLHTASATNTAVVAGSGEQAIVVAAGDTLWSIAGELAPEQDRRPVVDALARRNGGTTLLAGQTLVVPAALTTG